MFYVTDLKGDKIVARDQHRIDSPGASGVFDPGGEDPAFKAARSLTDA